MRAGSLMPGALSTPDDTSTISAPDNSMARATFSGSSPPARNHGLLKLRPARIFQSTAAPWPPGRVAPYGARASNIKRSATFSYSPAAAGAGAAAAGGAGGGGGGGGARAEA